MLHGGKKIFLVGKSLNYHTEELSIEQQKLACRDSLRLAI